MYCVYLTTYIGDKLPQYYVGSSSLSKINKGYCGSVSSKEFREIWQYELFHNRNLFMTEILSYHETRIQALEAELEYQVKNDVVNNPSYINKSLAKPSGFFGMNVTGENNPMYGRSRKGEKHKGGENIAKALKEKYANGELDHMKEDSSKRMKNNNPSYDRAIVEANKKRWKETGRGIGAKNGMYGKINPMKGKILYNNGEITKAYLSGEQPEGWVEGRCPKSIT